MYNTHTHTHTQTHTHKHTHTHAHTHTHTKEWQRGGFRVAASGEAASGGAGDVSNTAPAQETPQKKQKVHTHTYKHTHTNLGIVP